MSISMVKGENIKVTKEDGSALTNVLVGLGWDAKPARQGDDFDLDAIAIMCGDDDKMVSEKHFVYYGTTPTSNKLLSPCGSVEHTGDNRTGAGDGDDEAVKIDFKKVPDSVKKIAIAVTIHKAEERRQNFGQVSNSFVRYADQSTPQNTLKKYDLGEDYSTSTAMIFGVFYRNPSNPSEWKFKAVGEAVAGGMAGLITKFGGQPG